MATPPPPPPPPPQPTRAAYRPSVIALVTLAVLGVIAALWLGRGVFAPIGLALFLNTLFRPVVRRLEQWRVPSGIGAAILVLSLMGAMAGATAVLIGPARSWIDRAPSSLQVAGDKLRRLARPLTRLTAAVDGVGKAAAPADSVHTVTVATSDPKAAETAAAIAWRVVAGTAEVVLLLYLLLASGGTFLERLIGAIPGRADRRTAIRIAQEVENAVSGYLVVNVGINLIQSALVGVAVWLLGMPDPILWAVLTLFLELIPFVGGAVLVVLLLVAALATFDSIGHAMLVPLSYLMISAIQNNVASPLLYGNRLKLNAVAVLIAVLSWGAIWGVVGAFLAVPILATTKILCDHFESLGLLGRFLGNEPAKSRREKGAAKPSTA